MGRCGSAQKQRLLGPMIHVVRILSIVGLLIVGWTTGARADEIRHVEKPLDAAPLRVARSQPTVPDGWTEVPNIERARPPVPDAVEQERGFILFQRHAMDPVYLNSRPQPYERLTRLVAFASRGEVEALTFSIHPLRDLKNLRVRVSTLASKRDQIGLDALSVRLETHWNLRHPRYNSGMTYRRVPELLEVVTAQSSSLHENQRWWITVEIPIDAKTGIYEGTVLVWDDGFASAVSIPLSLRVLDFKLKSDPRKTYSVYADLGNSMQHGDRSETELAEALANEFRAMRQLGVDSYPTLYLTYDKTRSAFSLKHSEEIDRMQKAGFRGVVPVIADRAIKRILKNDPYRIAWVPHWKIDRLPPPEFYDALEQAFVELKRESVERDWPELVISPLDEIHPSRAEFGEAVYRSAKNAGFRTFITKDPTAEDAEGYKEVVDIWTSQAFAKRYEEIVEQDRFEFWTYPNHVAGEMKDRRVMNRGGRMTYGYGFWRSGYSKIIPWHWAWTLPPDQFDYLRSTRSGTGQRIDEEGEVIEAIYWQHFREGRDDARYIYTLQQAVWERQGSRGVHCNRKLREAESALRELWRSISVQPKYLDEGMWPSDGFDARRWQLAVITEGLLSCPARRSGSAPSVIAGVVESQPAELLAPPVLKAIVASGGQSPNGPGAPSIHKGNQSADALVKIPKKDDSMLSSLPDASRGTRSGSTGRPRGVRGPIEADDLDRDGRITLLDYPLWRLSFEESSSIEVPEPGRVASICAGVFCLALAAARRERSSRLRNRTDAPDALGRGSSPGRAEGSHG